MAAAVGAQRLQAPACLALAEFPDGDQRVAGFFSRHGVSAFPGDDGAGADADELGEALAGKPQLSAADADQAEAEARMRHVPSSPPSVD